MRQRWTSRLEVALWFFTYLIVSAWVAGQSFSEGRAGRSPMYDDVVYALTGQSVAIEAKLIGGGAALSNWASTPPHSPFSELIAITVHGIDLDWSSGLYIVNTILASILLFALSSLFSSVLSRQLIIASVLMASPIGFLAIDEFRPDVFFVLLSCFAILLVPLGRSLNGRLLPSESALLIGICLLYVKPSWAALAGVVIGTISLQAFIHRILRVEHPPSGPRPLFLALSAVATAVWAIWLGWTSFFVYVGGAVGADWIVAPSFSGAVWGSLSGILARVPTALLVLGVILVTSAAFDLLRSGSFVERNSPQFWQIMSTLLVPAVALLATGISQHPSRFQGMFIMYTLATTGFGLFNLWWRHRLAHASFGQGLSYVVGLPALLLFLTNPVLPSYPEEFRLRDSIPSSIAQVIFEASATSPDASSSGPNVATLFMEDVSPENVTYHLRGTYGLIATELVSVPPNPPSVKKLLDQIGGANFVVVRTTDYRANNVPLNRLQNELYSSLAISLPEVGRVDTVNHGSYVIFHRGDSVSP